MKIKPVVVEVTASERSSGALRTRRVKEILGYEHPDSVRQASLQGKFTRVGRGLYDLQSVLEYDGRRRRTGAAAPVETGERQ